VGTRVNVLTETFIIGAFWFSLFEFWVETHTSHCIAVQLGRGNQ
jgi:hypothetical protein